MTPDQEIAKGIIEQIENNYRGKSDEEIKEAAKDSINHVIFTFMIAGDKGVSSLVLTFTSCVKLTCSSKASKAKREAVIDLFNGPIGNLINENPELFFSDEYDDAYSSLNEIASKLKVILGNALYDILFAVAYICEPADQTVIDAIKEIYICNNSDNLIDQLIGNGMLVPDDASALRKASGQKTKTGPKDINWSSKVLSDGTLEITGYKGKDTTVIIPSEIKGRQVSSLCGHCLSPEKERLRKEQKEVYRKIKKVVISAGIKSIDGYAFECCENLEEIELNYGLESIGTRAFSGCEKLKEINVPDSVTFIGEEAFCCGSLEIIKMPEAPVRTLDPISSFNSISEPVFSGDMTKLYIYPRESEVKEYSIPDGIKYISNGAFGSFDGSKGLESLYVPEGVEYIGNFTFPGTLKKVYLPNSIREIDFAAFGYDETKPTVYTQNPYVIQYAKDHDIKVVESY